MSNDSLKASIRTRARENLAGQQEVESPSRTILDRIISLPEYRKAKTILFYVDVRHEVRTRSALERELAGAKQIAVPWCNDRTELELFRLNCVSELVPGRYGILEPASQVRLLEERAVQPKSVDLILVPGVAFDRRGGRIGQGKGYYDRLLAHVRPDCLLIAPAFDCQVFDRVPMDAHDVFMHRIVTESTVHSPCNPAT